MNEKPIKRITAAELLGAGYDTRVLVPHRPCPKCSGNKPSVIGAQCLPNGHIFGEYQCGYCGEIYGMPMQTR